MNNPVWDALKKLLLYCKKHMYFHGIRLNSAWIQHEFDMNSTPLWCKALRKTLWKFKVKMKSAWNQHEFSMNSTWIQHHCCAKCCAKHCENLRWKWNQHEFSMNSAWIRHEFNTNLISITVQSIVKKSVYKSFSMHYNLFVSYLNLN